LKSSLLAVDNRKLRLSAARVKEIRTLATEVLKKVKCEVAPVPVDLVAKQLNAEVLYAPYEGDDLAGMLINSSAGPIIAVNSAHHKNRQRFTIAHECGHLILGHVGTSYIDKTFEVIRRDALSSTATDMSEIEANQFAAETLMPLRFLLRDLPGGVDFESDEKVALLAKRYGVSAQAMAYRIANLFM
jgi:Zn-dependent peptidase ImmA (M78 family)